MQSIRTNTPCHLFANQALKSEALSLLEDNGRGLQGYLKTLTYTPLSTQKARIAPFVGTMNWCSGEVQKSIFVRFSNKFNLKTKNSFFKYALCSVGVLSFLALPAKIWLAHHGDAGTSKFEQIITNKELVVATIKDDSTVFNHGDLMHGFGYDIARQYADNLGVSMRLKAYDSQKDMLQALHSGEADMLLGTVDDDNVVINAVACNPATKNKIDSHGLNSGLGFGFLAADTEMNSHAQAFLCHQDQQMLSQSMARFYDQNLLKNDYSAMHFKQAISQKLPIYKHAFQNGADKYNHDWEVLAVISYQESHLNSDAVSRTGVQGLMMLTNDTAKAMGVKNRMDAVESIYGGAKYLEVLEKLYNDVPESDRLWFVLASYNMGPNAIKRIQSELNAKGRDGNSWAQVYNYLQVNANNNSRYVQCMHYVTNIRTYLETIKTMST